MLHNTAPKNSDRIIYALFALSGIAGLLYEGTWARYLKLFLGHSSYGQILTLCIYMGGLGIGSFLAARFSRNIRRPLRAYAITELGIGIGGLLYHPLYLYVTEWFYGAGWSAQLGSRGAEIIKIVLCIASTMPVAILLGLTFPWIASGLMRRHGDSGKVSIPILYFTNSLGAAFGLLLASYLLIPWLGTQGTLWLAAGLNTILAVSFFLIDLHNPPTDPQDSLTAPSPPPVESLSMPVPSLWLWIALLTGLTSFIYEIVWIRLLSLMMGSSTHSFDMMVSSFILGLSLGSLVSRKLLRRDALVMLALAQIFMGLLAISTVYSHSIFFEVMNLSNLFFRQTPWGYAGWNVLKYLVAVFWMVPTSFFAGMTLPFITYILGRSTRSESAVGKVYGFNTFGAIIGSIVGGLFLLPHLQLKWSLVSAAWLDILVGVVLLLVYRPAWRSKWLVWALLCAFLLPALRVNFDAHMVTSGVFRDYKDYLRTEKVWVANGKTATISFHESKVHSYIKTNGKPDASIRKDRSLPIAGDELTQAATAFVPMATRDAPYDAGMVGFGSGMSAYYLLSDPLLRRLDIVEIEQEMLNMAARFRPINARAFDDPRVHLYVDDARTFFHTHGQKYDVLVSVPSNPWVSGVSSLFSKEFYHHMQRYLKPGGTLVQWLQLYEFDNTLLLNIVRALDENFPYVVLYRIPEEPDIVILASDAPIYQKHLARFAKDSSIQAEFGRMHRPWYFFGEQNFLANSKSLRPLTKDVPANSEFIPWVDNNAEKARYAKSEVGINYALDSCTLCWPQLLDPNDFAQRKLQKDSIIALQGPDLYLEENVRHQLEIQMNSTKGIKHLAAVDVWNRIWSDFKILSLQVPYSPARDSIPEFAMMRKLVDAQQVPLEISIQFEFDDHLAHGRYREAVKMLSAFQDIFNLSAMDPPLLRQLALCAFLSGDTRVFRHIFQENYLSSPALDNSEKHLIAELLGLENLNIPLNSAIDVD